MKNTLNIPIEKWEINPQTGGYVNVGDVIKFPARMPTFAEFEKQVFTLGAYLPYGAWSQYSVVQSLYHAYKEMGIDVMPFYDIIASRPNSNYVGD